MMMHYRILIVCHIWPLFPKTFDHYHLLLPRSSNDTGGLSKPIPFDTLYQRPLVVIEPGCEENMVPGIGP